MVSHPARSSSRSPRAEAARRPHLRRQDRARPRSTKPQPISADIVEAAEWRDGTHVTLNVGSNDGVSDLWVGRLEDDPRNPCVDIFVVAAKASRGVVVGVSLSDVKRSSFRVTLFAQ